MGQIRRTATIDQVVEVLTAQGTYIKTIDLTDLPERFKPAMGRQPVWDQFYKWITAQDPEIPFKDAHNCYLGKEAHKYLKELERKRYVKQGVPKKDLATAVGFSDAGSGPQTILLVGKGMSRIEGWYYVVRDRNRGR